MEKTSKRRLAIAAALALCCCSAEKSNPSGSNSGGAGPYGGAGYTASSGGGSSTGVSGSDSAIGQPAGSGGNPSYICDAKEFKPQPKPVAVMILQDLSLSMTKVSEDGKTAWQNSIDAITAFFNDPSISKLRIQFGFDYFPDTAVNLPPGGGTPVWGCGVDDPVVIDVDIGTQPRILEWMNGATPAGNTPLYCAMNKFNDPNYAPSFTESSIDKYLVVVSDGADTCGVDCASNPDETKWSNAAQLEQVTLQLRNGANQLDVGPRAIKSIPIGFGNSVAPDQLKAIAKAGGVFDTYLSAISPEDLQKAFETIANAVVSCVWEIGSPDAKADPTRVNFYIGAEVVPHLTDPSKCDTTNGWIWSGGYEAVKFCNESCDKLRAAIDQVSAKYGCPTII